MQEFRNARALRLAMVFAFALLAVVHFPVMALAKWTSVPGNAHTYVVALAEGHEAGAGHVHHHPASEHDAAPQQDAVPAAPSPCPTPDCCAVVNPPSIAAPRVVLMLLATLEARPWLRGPAYNAEPAEPPPRPAS